MATRADELVREIEQTRAELTPTLIAVGEAVSPKRNIQKAKARAAAKIDHVKDRVSPARVARRKLDELRSGSRATPGRPAQLRGPARSRALVPVADKARDRPLVAGALAFVGAAAVAAAVRSTRTQQRGDGEADGRAAPPPRALEATRRKAGDAAAKLERGASEVKEGASKAARATRARAAGAAATAKASTAPARPRRAARSPSPAAAANGARATSASTPRRPAGTRTASATRTTGGARPRQPAKKAAPAGRAAAR